MQGSLASVVVCPAGVTLSGVAAGEPLHFEAVTGDSTYWALVPIPLDARDSLIARLTIERAGGAPDTVLVSVDVASWTAPIEQLEPSSEFGRPPDSALAVRAAREAESTRAVRRRSHDTPRLWQEPFLRPVPGRVTSGFGVWRQWNGVPGSRHDGVDLAGGNGTLVWAANRGVVSSVAEQYYGGLTVLIDHGAGLVTSYQHLSRVTVAMGDTVLRGQTIGRVGATGNVTGPHLHWGASYGAVIVDPIGLLILQLPPPTRPR